MLYPRIPYHFIIIFLLLLNQGSSYTFATSSTINSQNGLGASAKGQSSSQQIQSQVEIELKKTTSTLNPSHSLNNSNMNTQNNYLEDYKIKIFSYYKNTVLSLADKGYLTVDILNNSIKSKNHYFERIDSFSQNIKIRPYLESLQAIKREILKTSNVAEFEIFAENTLLDLLEHFQKTEEIQIESSNSTQYILNPKTKKILDFKNLDPLEFQVETQSTIIENGNLILTFAYKVSRHINLKNIFYIYNATTMEVMHKLDLKVLLIQNNIHSNTYKSYPIVKNNLGNNIVIIQTYDFRLHFIDLMTGKILYPSLKVSSIENFSILNSFELLDGRKILSILDEQEISFIDLDTGKPLVDKKHYSILGIPFKYNKTRPSIQIENLYKSRVASTKLKNGKTLLFLTTGSQLIFLDLETGNELYPRLLEKNFPLMRVSIQEGTDSTIALVEDDNKNYLYIDSETGKEIFYPTLEKAQNKSNFNFMPQIAINELNEQILIGFDFSEKMIIFKDPITDQDIFDPISIASHFFSSKVFFLTDVSCVLKYKNHFIASFMTNERLYFINLKNGKIIFYLDKPFLNTNIITKFFYSEFYKEFIFINHKKNKLYFFSVSSGIELTAPMEFDEDIKNVVLHLNPFTQIPIITVITNSGKIHIIDLMQTVSE